MVLAVRSRSGSVTTRSLYRPGMAREPALVELSEANGKVTASSVWTGMSMKNKFNNSVLIEGVVYGLDEGRLSAVEVATGKRLWKDKSYGYGQLVAADGKLIVLSEQGGASPWSRLTRKRSTKCLRCRR